MLSLRILVASVLIVLHSLVNAYNHFHSNKLFNTQAPTTHLLQDSSSFRKRIREEKSKNRKNSVVSLNSIDATQIVGMVDAIAGANLIDATQVVGLVDAAGGAISGATASFVGGTVGVMSVMILLEIKKKEDAGMESCPYCMGNGEILCATCCGCANNLKSNGPCSTCVGRGLVLCINCKGDGRITPIMLQAKSTRNPEFAADKVSIDGP
jgi:hypothetical protein